MRRGLSARVSQSECVQYQRDSERLHGKCKTFTEREREIAKAKTRCMASVSKAYRKAAEADNLSRCCGSLSCSGSEVQTFTVQTDIDACEIYLENGKGKILGSGHLLLINTHQTNGNIRFMRICHTRHGGQGQGFGSALLCSALLCSVPVFFFMGRIVTCKCALEFFDSKGNQTSCNRCRANQAESQGKGGSSQKQV